MGKHAQIVIGPAGTGKTTYCRAIFEHCTTINRTVHLVNLDPACENCDLYTINIQNLITVNDSMKELSLGPNGGLIFCMEFLLKNMNWFYGELSDYPDDYLIVDCPGQIELYSHYNVMNEFIKSLERNGYHVCVVYLIDASFVTNTTKFISGSLACLSAMLRFEVPHVNILSKCDLIPKKEIEMFLEQDVDDLKDKLNRELGTSNNIVEEEDEEEEKEGEEENLKKKKKKKMAPTKKDIFTSSSTSDCVFQKYKRLNEVICDLLDQFSLVSFLPLNITEQESIEFVLSQIDFVLQYGEDIEPKMVDYEL